MKCSVCNGLMSHYFDKMFGEERHEYVRCENCGMVVDKTLWSISKKEWEDINFNNHKAYHENYTTPEEDEVDPRWKDRIKTQIETLKVVFNPSILREDANIVDFGCGNGMLADGFNGGVLPYEIKKYEKYMASIFQDGNYLSYDELKSVKWDAIITCSVLEHIVGRDDLNQLLGFLNDISGIFILHTLVCEEVPCDPDWFYLIPGHCTLYTNKAMSLLYEQYNFKGCAYHPQSRLWFFFKSSESLGILRRQREEVQGGWVFGDKFIDYWKEKPYR